MLTLLLTNRKNRIHGVALRFSLQSSISKESSRDKLLWEAKIFMHDRLLRVESSMRGQAGLWDSATSERHLFCSTFLNPTLDLAVRQNELPALN
jgi:hypothetical protein